MPLFYFDILDDRDAFDRDDTGSIYPDVWAARDAACEVLPNVARDILPDGDMRRFVCTVRDEKGQEIFEATLSFVGKWKIDPHKA